MKLGLKLAFLNASASAVWPCTGIALAAFLILGYRVWPAILIGAFLVNLTTAGSVATSIRRPLQFASWRLLRPGELCMGLAHFHDSKHVSAAVAIVYGHSSCNDPGSRRRSDRTQARGRTRSTVGGH